MYQIEKIVEILSEINDRLEKVEDLEKRVSVLEKERLEGLQVTFDDLEKAGQKEEEEEDLFEEWLPIIWMDRETDREVSNFGNVRDSKTKQLITPRIQNGSPVVSVGYKFAGRRKDTTITIAKCVYRAFVSPYIPARVRIFHKDGDLTNNKVGNLRRSEATEKRAE